MKYIAHNFDLVHDVDGIDSYTIYFLILFEGIWHVKCFNCELNFIYHSALTQCFITSNRFAISSDPFFLSYDILSFTLITLSLSNTTQNSYRTYINEYIVIWFFIYTYAIVS